MKNVFLSILSLLIIAFALSGCYGKSAEPSETQPVISSDDGLNEGTASIANPLVDVDSPDAFAPLGIAIDAPEGASDVRYTVIGNEMAQVIFTFDGHQYCLRATRSMSDIEAICGYYGQYVPSDRLSRADYYLVEGTSVAGWNSGGVYYSCTCDNEESLAAVVEQLLNGLSER